VTSADQRLNWFGTARMRLGMVPEQQWLLYATGGFAFGGGKLTTNIVTDSGNCAIGICEYGSGSKTLTGWTVGGGIEYALLNNWSIKAEYLYYDLGKISHGSTDISSGTTDFHPAADFTGNLVKLGFNYKFGAPN
jgi:outer membrane immunogenic protein